MAVVDLSGLDRLTARLRKLQDPDAKPLLFAWEKIISDDNRRGIMARTDAHGNPMAPVKYRPVGPKKQQLRPRRRGVMAFQAAGGNLPTPAEYRRMTGPPTAPRGLGSRVITNLVFRSGRIDATRWQAVGYWEGVVDRYGRPFLQYLFRKWDLRGVRPDGLMKAAKAARAWMISEIRANG